MVTDGRDLGLYLFKFSTSKNSYLVQKMTKLPAFELLFKLYSAYILCIKSFRLN